MRNLLEIRHQAEPGSDPPDLEVVERGRDIYPEDRPNIFSHRPMLAMEPDLADLCAVGSCSVHGFNERLMQLLPGISDHHCAWGKPGGLVKRLHDGTYSPDNRQSVIQSFGISQWPLRPESC